MTQRQIRRLGDLLGDLTPLIAAAARDALPRRHIAIVRPLDPGRRLLANAYSMALRGSFDTGRP